MPSSINLPSTKTRFGRSRKHFQPSVQVVISFLQQKFSRGLLDMLLLRMDGIISSVLTVRDTSQIVGAGLPLSHFRD